MAAGQRPRPEHQHAAQRGPGGVHPGRRGHREPGQGQGHDDHGETGHGGRGRRGRHARPGTGGAAPSLRGSGSGGTGGTGGDGHGADAGGGRGHRLGQVRAEEAAEHGVLDGDRGQPGQRHQRGEPGEGQPTRRERQQVGQVGDRQEQRGGVRQMRGRVHVRAGPRTGPGGGGQDHGGEQYGGRVQTEHGRDRAGHGEDPGQQPPRTAAAPAGHGGADGLEQALLGAQVRQHQHECEEDDDRQQRTGLLPRPVRGDHAERHDQHGGGHGGHRLRQPRGRSTAKARTPSSRTTGTASERTVVLRTAPPHR